MKILYATTIGETMGFFTQLIKHMLNEGHVIDIVTNEDGSFVPQEYKNIGCNIYQVSWSRNPISIKNLISIYEVKKIIVNGQYDIIHCHTPVCSACIRIACISLRKNGLKVFYTAHGFHFFKGAPLKNWLIYYPIEWICAYWTDILITINKEDYAIAKLRMHAKQVLYVPGVGINWQKYHSTIVAKNKKRIEIGIPEDCIVLLSVGELNKNKNHQVIIRALARIKNQKLYYIIAGSGAYKEHLENLSKTLGVEDKVKLLGHRNDVNELCKIADIFCFPSHREGLGLGAIEAMTCGLPLVTSNIHGINDYSIEGKTGYKCNPNDYKCFKKAIEKLVFSEQERERIGKYNIEVSRKYDIKKMIDLMMSIYNFR
jgi:glycosyltransferase involved in cell wall biosynthesis